MKSLAGIFLALTLGAASMGMAAPALGGEARGDAGAAPRISIPRDQHAGRLPRQPRRAPAPRSRPALPQARRAASHHAGSKAGNRHPLAVLAQRAVLRAQAFPCGFQWRKLESEAPDPLRAGRGPPRRAPDAHSRGLPPRGRCAASPSSFFPPTELPLFPHSLSSVRPGATGPFPYRFEIREAGRRVRLCVADRHPPGGPEAILNLPSQGRSES